MRALPYCAVVVLLVVSSVFPRAVTNSHYVPMSTAVHRSPVAPSRAPIASTRRPVPGSPNKQSMRQAGSSDNRSKSGVRPNADHEAGLRALKRQRALTLLDGVLRNADNISSDDYRLLTLVEAATVLWQQDRDQALSILKSAVAALRRVLDGQKELTQSRLIDKSREQMVWFLVIRKIAALQPELARQLLSVDGSDVQSGAGIKDEWTIEARAVLSAASELTERDPKLAARTAEQALYLGLASYMGFLRTLANRDNTEAERLSMIVIDRLNHVSVTLLHLRNLLPFMLSPDRTVRLRNYYCRGLATRLRMEFRPAATPEELADALNVANTMAREAGRDNPYWREQFEGIRSAIGTIFKERSLAFPTPPERISIDTLVSLAPASAGDTEAIQIALLSAGSIRDSNASNREYQKLAVNAANRADKRLAEEIMSRITDASIQQETSTMVYSPLVRAALKDSLWARAQQLTSLITDPIARTLIFINTAREMTRAGVDRFSLADHYTFALRKLNRDDPTDRLAKAYLLIARPLLDTDRDRGIEAIRSCAQILSRISRSDQALQESPIGSAAATWIRYSDPSLSADEVLNLPELVTGTFASIAQRDPENALEIASWIEHRGMYSLAQLPAIKVLLSEVNTPPKRTARPNTKAAARLNN